LLDNRKWRPAALPAAEEGKIYIPKRKSIKHLLPDLRLRKHSVQTAATMSVPPELHLLCRKLTSTPVDDLPRLCPLLVGYVFRCSAPLSAVPEAKAKDKSSEVSVLLHKLRTHINTLLNGRNPAGRFSAICLIKAVIDVGGWESLRQSESWIRGLISILQVSLSMS